MVVVLRQASRPIELAGRSAERIDRVLRRWPVATAAVLAIAATLATIGFVNR